MKTERRRLLMEVRDEDADADDDDAMVREVCRPSQRGINAI
jgi:hypothetical protein